MYRCIVAALPLSFHKKNKKQKKNTRQYHANKELLKKKKKKNVVWWHVLDFNESKTLEAHYIIQGLSLT